MKRDPHLETPDTEQQSACYTGRHEGPIAFLHLVQQGQLDAAPSAACFNAMLRQRNCQNKHEVPQPCPRSVKSLLRAKQDSHILKRLNALVDPRSTHPPGHGAVIVKSCVQKHCGDIVRRL
ncbi:hypothetical protein [Bradyrhizobium sp. USDA 3364]